MFHPPALTLAVSNLGIWFLLPIAIIIPVDVIVLGTLLLVASNARRKVMESPFWSSGFGENPARRSQYGFYVDPNDERLWVPRPRRPSSQWVHTQRLRSSSWTINLGHPKGLFTFAWFVGAITLVPTGIIVVVFLILSLTLPSVPAG